MERREFCRLAAIAAVGSAFSGGSPDAFSEAGRAAPPSEAKGFGALSGDYAAFCATPPSKRRFYEISDGKIVETRLNHGSWKPAGATGYWNIKLPIPGDSWYGVPMQAPVANLNGRGPYQATWNSLLQYEAPEWFRDAKFGIWAHWSPQCVPEADGWYARNMYIQGSHANKFQMEHYGPPSRAGFKNLCAEWTLLNWEPDALIRRYKAAGARLFLALANHHPGFDTWDSKHQPWNAINMGPRRDVVGAWARAARRQGLRFGVTVHQARNWWWLQTSHGADSTGPLQGVPYDGDLVQSQGVNRWWQGLDPQRLYAPKHPLNALPDPSYVKDFYDRTRDLVDQHDPDLLYFDDGLLPLGWGGMNIGAYFYNHNLATHGGKMEAVLNVKYVPDHLAKAVVADYERGSTSEIMPYPWQSETCIGGWFYIRDYYDQPGKYGGYLPPVEVIHWLVDTVSKNGTFILNIPGKPDGTLDSKEVAVLDGITEWMGINGEAIYETRPWKIYGEGPNAVKAGSFQGTTVSRLGEKDIRFTRNKANTVVNAIFMGSPTGQVTIKALGTAAPTNPGRIEHVRMLGTSERLHWEQKPDSLQVQMPQQSSLASTYGVTLQVLLKS